MYHSLVCLPCFTFSNCLTLSLLLTTTVPNAYSLVPEFQMRRRVTWHLTRIQAVWHSDNIFTNFGQHWTTLKLKQTRNLAEDNLFSWLRVKTNSLLRCRQNMSRRLRCWVEMRMIWFGEYSGLESSHVSFPECNSWSLAAIIMPSRRCLSQLRQLINS